MWMTEVENNVGVFVKHVLAKPEISLPAKYVSVHTDIRPYVDALTAWSEVSGKRAEFIEVSDKQMEGIMGFAGKEFASQLRLNEVAPDWGKAHVPNVVTAEGLGIAKEELLDMRQCLEANKNKL